MDRCNRSRAWGGLGVGIVLGTLGATTLLAACTTSPVPSGYPQIHEDMWGGVHFTLDGNHDVTMLYYDGFVPEPAAPSILLLWIEGDFEHDGKTFRDVGLRIPSTEVRSYTAEELDELLAGYSSFRIDGDCVSNSMSPLPGTYSLSVDGNDGKNVWGSFAGTLGCYDDLGTQQDYQREIAGTFAGAYE
jgi:hypothetical protein